MATITTIEVKIDKGFDRPSEQIMYALVVPVAMPVTTPGPSQILMYQLP